MDNNTRLEATRVIWIALAIALGMLFFSSGIAGGLQAGHTILGVALIILGFLSTGMVWNWGDMSNTTVISAEKQEKIKREQIDNIISQLSDEELHALKRRLSDGSMDEDMLYEQMALTDDGELVHIDRRR